MILARNPEEETTEPVLGTPAYLLEGSALTINFKPIQCDSYLLMQGRISTMGFSGRYFTSGLETSTDLGVAYGAPVNTLGYCRWTTGEHMNGQGHR